MTAATITAAGALAELLADERDPWHARISLISSIEIIAEAYDSHDHGDTHSALLNFAAELRGQLFADALAIVDRNDGQAEADRYGGFVTVLIMEDAAARKQHERDMRLRLKVKQEYQPVIMLKGAV